MKIPIANIYYLLAYAWDRLPEKNIASVDTENCKNSLDLLAKVLVQGCGYLTRRGVYKDYISVHEDTNRPRGRWDLHDTVKRGLLSRQLLSCEYSEMSDDILHNQILKATFKKLLATVNLNSSIHKDIHAYYLKMRHISDIDLTSKHFLEVKPHRNNLFYGFLLSICRLILHNLLPSGSNGKYKFREFIYEDEQMDSIFERFVRNFYRRHLPKTLVKSEHLKWNDVIQETGNGKLSNLPEQHTDTTIISDNAKTIIETKYYSEIRKQGRFLSSKISSDNLRQLITYLNLCPTSTKGILLYAQTDCDEKIAWKYKINNKDLWIYSLDLNQDWQNIHSDLLNLVNI